MVVKQREVALYSLYLTKHSVELYSEEDYCLEGRFICSQQNYQNILDFGTDLARCKGLPLIDHVAALRQTENNE